ncbi:MAG TPA: twin-arginine translocase TatA/TatE family subunit [Chroococcales cyanobacterium]
MLNSPVDIAIIAGVVLLIFGPKKVPELGKALGQGIGNFKKALTEAQDEVSKAAHEAEHGTAKPESNASAATPNSAPQSSSIEENGNGAKPQEKQPDPTAGTV